MFESVTHRITLTAAALACATLVALLTPGCKTSPKTQAGRDEPPPAKAAVTSADDPVAGDVDRFAERLATVDPSKPANAEVQWTSPMIAAQQPDDTAPQAQANPNIQPVAVERSPQPPAAKPKPRKPADPADLSAEQLVRELSARLQQSAGDKPSLRQYLARAALSLYDPARELTAADLTDLNADDRKLILAYQRAFTLLGRSLGHNIDEDRQQLQIAATELIDQLDAHPTTLRLKNAQLCTRVNGFGVYEPFESTTFLAGSEHPAIIYAELENFTPRIESDGRYAVRLTQQVTLYNEADGLAVWRIRPTQITDFSHNRRRDFFVVQLINLPARLGVGKYNLKISVTDEVGQQIDEAEIPIKLVADRNLLHE